MAHQFETKLRRLERDLRYFKQQLQEATRQERIAILEQIRNVEQEILNTLNEQTAEINVIESLLIHINLMPINKQQHCKTNFFSLFTY